MDKTFIASQVYIGLGDSDSSSYASVEKKIVTAKELADINALMIWAPTVELFNKISSFCRSLGIQSYLWFPVLADVHGYTSLPTDWIEQFSGKTGNGNVARWKNLIDNGEEFLFICPNKDRPIQQIFFLFKELISRLDIDGVMLDRIRYPSCANGFETLFSCFCPNCQKKYLDQTGHSLELHRNTAKQFFSILSGLSAQTISRWKNWASMWEHLGLSDFVAFREQNIHDLVSGFSNWARQRGLIVGLDLYSSFLSPLVGQNLAKLSSVCDWMKPMCYIQGNGPACLPLEISCLWEALTQLCPNLSQADIHDFLEKMMAIQLPKSKEQLLSQGLNPEAIGNEINLVGKLDPSPKAKIYPGIVTMQDPQFQVTMDQITLEKSLEQINIGTEGFVASWNLLNIPVSYWQTIGRFLR